MTAFQPGQVTCMPMAMPVEDTLDNGTHMVVAASEPQFLTVTVPESMEGGAQVTIATTKGDRVVTIPEGLKEGEDFQVQV